jgi:hypothetical protein
MHFFDVFVKDDLLYGKIPLNEYDNCFRVGKYAFDCFYVTERNGKYGLLSSKLECISEPVLDEVLLYNPKNKWSNGMYKTSFIDKKTGKSFGAIFVITRIAQKYILYNAETGKCIIDDCERMVYRSACRRTDYDFIEYERNDKIGFVSTRSLSRLFFSILLYLTGRPLWRSFLEIIHRNSN